MKKITVLVALALLAATGTSYAVTCSQDNVPAATLLVPFFKVSRNNASSGNIPEGGVDTLVAMTNVSQWGIVAHVTVWNKQSAPVLDFNVPMTGYDVAFFRMKDVLNGNLNVNPNTQKSSATDPCKNAANIGTAQDDFMRFSHPQWGVTGSDWFDSIGFYASPAFGPSFKARIWDSLDESADYTSLIASPGDDDDNPACGVAGDGAYQGDFSGYLTIDVVNYCTNWFPSQAEFYTWDAIATRGWNGNDGPNVLMGDFFFIDPAGNISGDAAVGLEFDTRLEAEGQANWNLSVQKTFYARYSLLSPGISDPRLVTPAYIVPYTFSGDGREPLGTVYGFRYLNDAAAGLSTSVVVWRGDRWDADDTTTVTAPSGLTLCDLDANGRPVAISTWDNDEQVKGVTGGGPSGDVPLDLDTFVWWEANRITYGGADMNPGGYKGGWTKWTFQPNNSTRYNQAWVGVQHTAPGAFVSVGFNATVLDQQITCFNTATFTTIGNVDFGN